MAVLAGLVPGTTRTVSRVVSPALSRTGLAAAVPVGLVGVEPPLGHKIQGLKNMEESIVPKLFDRTFPDEIVRAADQQELVDMTPYALRRRMAHGNIYPPEKVDAALGNYFRVGNLTALRELALLWLADKVDEQLDRYRAEHQIGKTWEARERVVQEQQRIRVEEAGHAAMIAWSGGTFTS